MSGNTYLYGILNQYAPRDLASHQLALQELGSELRAWANTCFVEILNSGSRAKGTAIRLASDVDLLVSLTSNCNENSGGLASIYDGLISRLEAKYGARVRRQNVSARVTLSGLEIDVTPARRQPGPGNDHWLFLSKSRTRKQTNIQRHISDISGSGRTDEIKILKIWRELHQLEFPSIYLEYLLVQKILHGRSKASDALADNVWYSLCELAKAEGNPLYARIVDPANSSNILSDLISVQQKHAIANKAKSIVDGRSWSATVW